MDRKLIPRVRVANPRWKIRHFADLGYSWEVFNYINDDPNAKYRTPRNWGHEAMHYLTFIIDEYYRLPDYVVFLVSNSDLLLSLVTRLSID